MISRCSYNLLQKSFYSWVRNLQSEEHWKLCLFALLVIINGKDVLAKWWKDVAFKIVEVTIMLIGERQYTNIVGPVVAFCMNI